MSSPPGSAIQSHSAPSPTPDRWELAEREAAGAVRRLGEDRMRKGAQVGRPHPCSRPATKDHDPPICDDVAGMARGECSYDKSTHKHMYAERSKEQSGGGEGNGARFVEVTKRSQEEGCWKQRDKCPGDAEWNEQAVIGPEQGAPHRTSLPQQPLARQQVERQPGHRLNPPRDVKPDKTPGWFGSAVS